MEIIPLKTPLIKPNNDIAGIIAERANAHDIADGDIIVVSSKVVALAEGRIVDYTKINAGKRAKKLAQAYSLEDGFAQLVVDEADAIFGGVRRAIMTLKNGIFVANAGIDHSNAPINHAILWPNNPQRSAVELRKKLSNALGKRLGVIICDSHCIPLRAGSAAVAIGISGMHAVIDERGKKDLFERELLITRRAVADNLSCAAVSVMGECAECTPAAIVRGANVHTYEGKEADAIDANNIASTYIAPSECLYACVYTTKLRMLGAKKKNVASNNC